MSMRKVPKPRALAQLRLASSHTSLPRRGASPASLSSKDALKTHLRSTPTVFSKAPVQSAPAMLTCPYCPKQCPTQVGLSVHLTRWCKRNPSGAVPPQSLGSRRVPAVSQLSKAPRQAASVIPRPGDHSGDHKAEPLVQSTPAVVRRGATAPAECLSSGPAKCCRISSWFKGVFAEGLARVFPICFFRVFEACGECVIAKQPCHGSLREVTFTACFKYPAS